jgi:hypothetical protein
LLLGFDSYLAPSPTKAMKPAEVNVAVGDFGSFGTAISFVLVRRKRRFGTAPT